MREFVELAVFEYVMILCIAANAIVLAAESDGIKGTEYGESSRTEEKHFGARVDGHRVGAAPYFLLLPTHASCRCFPSSEAALSTMNDVFTWIFAVEMLFKLIAYSFLQYISDSFNVFDGIIVIFGLLDFALTRMEINAAALSIIQVFRLCRIVRVVKLVRYLESMQVIIEVIASSMSSFTYLFLLLILFMFIFSVLGMQLFAGQLNFDVNGNNPPRENFDSLDQSIITVFIVLTGENWNAILMQGVNASGYFSTLYYVSWDGVFAFLPLCSSLSLFVPLFVPLFVSFLFSLVLSRFVSPVAHHHPTPIPNPTSSPGSSSANSSF